MERVHVYKMGEGGREGGERVSWREGGRGGREGRRGEGY